MLFLEVRACGWELFLEQMHILPACLLHSHPASQVASGLWGFTALMLPSSICFLHPAAWNFLSQKKVYANVGFLCVKVPQYNLANLLTDFNHT